MSVARAPVVEARAVEPRAVEARAIETRVASPRPRVVAPKPTRNDCGIRSPLSPMNAASGCESSSDCKGRSACTGCSFFAIVDRAFSHAGGRYRIASRTSSRHARDACRCAVAPCASVRIAECASATAVATSRSPTARRERSITVSSASICRNLHRGSNAGERPNCTVKSRRLPTSVTKSCCSPIRSRA